MQSAIRRFLLLMIAVCLVLYCVDTLLWRLHEAHGIGTDQITVQQVSAAELKRNREEYYLDDAITLTCARSIFPPLTSEGWLPPCWYLRRHLVVVTHI